jgi:uncharacterized membrane protein
MTHDQEGPSIPLSPGEGAEAWDTEAGASTSSARAQPWHDSAEEVLFDALITPGRRLDPHGLAAVMVVLGVVIFTVGMAFLLNGAWPVFGFFGLGLVLVYWAFRVTLRRDRASEYLHLTRSAFCIRRVDTRGRTEEVELQPYWLRVEIWGRQEAEEIRLRSHGVAHRVGVWLSPIERLTLAEAIEDALAALHSPPPLTRPQRER